MNQDEKALILSRRFSCGVPVIKGNLFWIFLLRLLFACGLAAPLLASGVTFEVEGVVTYAVFELRGQVIQQKQRNFRAFVSTNAWWIRTESNVKPREITDLEKEELSKIGVKFSPSVTVYSGADGGNLATECSSDGESLYLAQYFIKNQAELEQRKKKDPSYIGQSDTLDIFHRSFPTYDVDLSFPVWLALASQTYFRQPEMRAAPMVWMNYAPSEDSGREFTVKTHLHCPDVYCLPEEISFENRGFFAQRGGQEIKIVDYSAYPTNAFLEAQYQATVWRQSSNYDYPVIGEFAIYPYGTKTGELAKAVIRSTVTINAFTETYRVVTGRPVVTNLFRVTDHRLDFKKPLSYRTTNGFAQPGEPRMARILEKASNDYSKKTTLNKRLVIIIIFGLVTSVSVGLLLLRKEKNNKHI